jgi:hypothetical protein
VTLRVLPCQEERKREILAKLGGQLPCHGHGQLSGTCLHFQGIDLEQPGAERSLEVLDLDRDVLEPQVTDGKLLEARSLPRPLAKCGPVLAQQPPASVGIALDAQRHPREADSARTELPAQQRPAVELHGTCGRHHERLLVIARQDPGIGETQLRAAPPKARVHRPDFHRPPQRLTGPGLDLLAVFGNLDERDPDEADHDRQQDHNDGEDAGADSPQAADQARHRSPLAAGTRRTVLDGDDIVLFV